MKQYFVKDLNNSIGLTGESVFVLAKKEQKITRGNKPYLNLILRDRTGEIEAKVWSDNLPQAEATQTGDVVEVDFAVQSFQDKVELVVRAMKKVQDYDLQDLIYVAENVDFESLKIKLSKRIDSVRDFHLRKLLDGFFNNQNFREAFLTAPAGEKVHHNYLHGLLHHTMEMLILLDAVTKLYPDLNKDLLVTGILLHDIGKLKEIKMNEVGNVTRTVQGKLLGHLHLGIEMVEQRLPKDFPEKLKMHLTHIVLSHQGKKEWGSPVIPATREAIVVHYADLTSTYLNIAQKTRENGLNNKVKQDLEESFSEYNKYLGTSVYLGK